MEDGRAIRLNFFSRHGEMVEEISFGVLQTLKSFFEETLHAVPDFVLDAPISGPQSTSQNPFVGIRDILPPPYDSKEQELMYA